MLNAFTTIGLNISSTLCKAAKSARRQAIIAAAVAATGIVAVNKSFASDVTSITTTLLPGISSSVDNVSGYGDASTGFTPSNSYNMSYAGEDLRVDSVTTSSGTFVPAGVATTTVRRFDGPNTDIIWYQGTGNASSGTLNLDAGQVDNFAQAFSGNNLLVGTDNLFANTGNAAGNDTNVERLDTIFGQGFNASSTTAFTIFDRGLVGQHDPFKIAAITSLDGNGVPNGYGPLLSYALGTWGNTQLTPVENYIVTRRNDDIPGDNYHPSDEVQQSIGGVLIPTSALVSTPGEKIYGYSLFAGDTDGSGNQLVNWENTNVFPDGTSATGTTAATDSGGLDAIGTTAVLFSSAVPEPTTASIMLLSIGGLIARRPKRTLA